MTCSEKQNLCLIKGDTLSAQVIWNDGTGSPINLTSYTVVLAVTVGGVTTNYTSGSGLTITPLAGQIDIVIPDDDTEDWVANPTYRLKATSAGGVTTTLMHGMIEVTDAG